MRLTVWFGAFPPCALRLQLSGHHPDSGEVAAEIGPFFFCVAATVVVTASLFLSQQPDSTL